MCGVVCPSGWHLHGPDGLWDWFIREGRLELCLEGSLLRSRSQLCKMLSLPFFLGPIMMTSWLAWSIRLTYYPLRSPYNHIVINILSLNGPSLGGLSVSCWDPDWYCLIISFSFSGNRWDLQINFFQWYATSQKDRVDICTREEWVPFLSPQPALSSHLGTLFVLVDAYATLGGSRRYLSWNPE